MMLSQIAREMIDFSQGNLHDIDHLLKVHAYARIIGQSEGLDPERQFALEAAALIHDIACPLCREKYGNTNGKYQEKEGAPMVCRFLSRTGLNSDQIDRVVYLVGHHHSYFHIEGMDYQILLEADFIANAFENGYSWQKIEYFMQKYMKTKYGSQLACALFRDRRG